MIMEIIALLLIILAAILNAGMDTLYGNYESSIFKNFDAQFWNPYISWENKWKNGDRTQGERFLFSSTFLVPLTDGWHLLKTLMLLCLAGVLSLPINYSWYNGLIFLCVFCGTFEITLRIFRK